MAGPGDVGRVYRVLHAGKIIHDQRSWLKYLRREAVVRALNREGGIVTERIGEAADQICEALQRTDLFFEPADGVPNRVGTWTREKITRGIRFPDYSGPARATFFERLFQWVAAAAQTERGTAALDYVAYPQVEERAKVFAVAVANEVRGLLAESRRPPGQDRARYRMARDLFDGTPDREVRRRHEVLRAWIQAFVAGVVAGVSSELLFTDSWIDSLGVGATVFGGSVVRDLAQGRLFLPPDMLAVRRHVKSWLAMLPRRLSRSLEWSGRDRSEEVLQADAPLTEMLDCIGHGQAHLPPAEAGDPNVEDIDDLIRLAGEVEDRELRGLLVDVRRALKVATNEVPEAFTSLILFLEQEPKLSRLPTARPAIASPDNLLDV
ncbi:hypothetical protein [Streptomyces sp. 8N616]|uniref:hypothetical protein n=1 Tax=Streptomyces sp. 8N616 TaxID=3457414 RepID=UPI003FD611C6